MKILKFILFSLSTILIIGLNSCASGKIEGLQKQLDVANSEIDRTTKSVSNYMTMLEKCEQENLLLESEIRNTEKTSKLRKEQIDDLKAQILDLKAQRDQYNEQVESLTVLSQQANDNIKETLGQLDGKDKYLRLLQAAKTKTDSINLALAVNLKGALARGIDDQDIDIKVDKTVVMINLSDKMLFQSGSSFLNPRAKDVLGKIANIIANKPELEVMVEGYTDNVPMNNSCVVDNWDLSVKRSASVVRVLQKEYGVNPNRLIAAGRGEYNTLASNDTSEGRAVNRRTRIIILPKLNEFYDLLNPENAAK